jgi:hypothetical protein
LDVFYHNGIRNERFNENLYTPGFRQFIDSIGIGKNDKVISTPDPTPDVSLYLINRPGWSNYRFPEIGNITYNPVGISRTIDEGAHYLIISDTSAAFLIPGVKLFPKKYMGHYGNIYIYKLPGQKMTTLRSSDGAYIFSGHDAARNLTANKNKTEILETFSIIDLGTNKIALKAGNDKFVSTLPDQGGILSASKDVIDKWETFEKMESGSNRFALKAANGKMVTCDRNQGGRLIANGELTDDPETLELQIQ